MFAAARLLVRACRFPLLFRSAKADSCFFQRFYFLILRLFVAIAPMQAYSPRRDAAASGFRALARCTASRAKGAEASRLGAI
ncbi:hypothetical protein [Cohnella sp. REN36]|uniref:hypothetical protein n=1 Tax=Cohnella sp. REN36 TaxID=2887347 RepID=UPI001D14E61F|nr:hypothetical protein [Cohnella sp. REN36]MCC3377580.1 hypothetical protein [Cohnella sp. REN36]